MSSSVVNVRGAGVANIFRFKFGRLHRTLFAPLERRIMAAITDPQRVGELLRAIEGYKGTPITRAALQLAPLVFVRPGELRS